MTNLKVFQTCFAYTLLVCLLSALFTACAIPRSKQTHLNISGQILDAEGMPLANQKVEVVLPATYGLNDLDMDLGSPESYGQSDLRHTVTTDASGTFTCSFSPLKYTATTYILPPLGSFPRKPPEPLFYLRLADSPGWYYAIKVSQADVLFGIYAEHDYLSMDRVQDRPMEINGQLISDRRKENLGWTADLELKYKKKPSRAQLAPK